LRRFGAAFFAFFRAAMVHPLVDESDRHGRSRARTLSPFFPAVKGMLARMIVACSRITPVSRNTPVGSYSSPLVIGEGSACHER
jgi:hypothetical protein